MTQTTSVLTEINFPSLNLFKKGKVRSVFDFGNELLIVASDRVSAFDYILPNGIPHKGEVLTTISNFWFNKLGVNHHMISTKVEDFPEETKPYHKELKGRSMLVKKTDLIEVECVVRGYLIGSGWKEYQKDGTVCKIKLPKNIPLAGKLPEPIFTPASKAQEGHDENISTEKMADLIGNELTEKLKTLSLSIYQKGQAYAASKGIILADTKFEFGLLNGEIILIDEVLTPDSSRYWPKEAYKEGISPPSYDKQIIRDHLERSGWNKKPPVPNLPEAVIQKASKKYLEVKDLLLT